jgi:hypothetical protein
VSPRASLREGAAGLAGALDLWERRIALAGWTDLIKLVAVLVAVGVVTAGIGVYPLGFLVMIAPLGLLAFRNSRVACVLVAMLSPFVSISAVDVGFHFLPVYVLIACGVAGALLRREWRGVQLHPVDFALAGFAVLAIIISTATFGTAPSSTVLGATGVNSPGLRSPAQLAALLLMMGLYVLFRLGIREREAIAAPVRGLLVTFVFAAAYGLYQGLARSLGLPFGYVNERRSIDEALPQGGGHAPIRINSTLPEASPFASFAFIALVVGAAVLLVRDVKFMRRPAAIGLTALALVILLVTLSKAAILAALITLPLLLTLRRRSVSAVRFRLLVAAAGAALLLLTLGAIALRTPDALSNPTNLAAGERYVRVGYWETSLNIAAAHPLGVGVGNYTFYYPRYAPLSAKYEYFPVVADSHSWYLEALAETGVLGGICFALFAFSLPIAVLRRSEQDGEQRHIIRALAVAWLAVALMHLTYSYFYYPFEWVLAGLVAVALSLRRREASAAR